MTTRDPFVGTWKLNPQQSEFDPNHRPSDATMTWARDGEGAYLLTAEGTSGGKKVAERPQRIVPDERPYPVADFPGLTVVALRPAVNTIQMECKREDGSLAGQATYAVSADGSTLAATNTGYDSQLRQFRQYTVWERV